MKRNQKGFGAVEGLLILIIVGLVGFIGWYVYHTKSNTNSTYNNADNTSQATQQNKSTTGGADTALIKDAVKNDCESTSGSSATAINVTKQEGNYAAATIACSNSTNGSPTNRDYLKKTNGSWSVVLKGGGVPTTNADLAPYGFPSDFL